ncbi:MAG: tandem-95 repeat protein, partial [Proteobacteria bacterium]|nr:tandem-95 repeat protein [Pseudomonadota bacterium]
MSRQVFVYLSFIAFLASSCDPEGKKGDPDIVDTDGLPSDTEVDKPDDTADSAKQPDNRAPVATDDSATTDEDSDVAVGVLANDTDEDGDALSIIGIKSAVGTVTDEGGGVLRYFPEGKFEQLNDGDSAEDFFSYTVSDTEGNTDEGQVTITIAGVNDAPVPADDAYAVDEGAVLEVDALAGVLTNDNDVDDTDLVALIEDEPTKGILVLNDDGSFTYTHDGGETSSDTFTYTVNDAQGATALATVAITINPVNDKPEAEDDEAEVKEGQSVTITVLDNDTDSDDGIDPTSVEIFTDPEFGTLTVNNDGTVDYEHDGSETTDDSFKYKVSDFAGESSKAAEVTIDIKPRNDAPEVTDPGKQTNKEADSVTLQIYASDPDSDITYSATNLPGGLNIDNDTGEITGTIDYEAAEDSPYDVIVTVSDGKTATDVTFEWKVKNTNREPTVAHPGPQVNAEGTIIALPISASDPDNDTLIFTATGLPPNLDIDADTGLLAGTIDYEAAANSPYEVTVTVSDGDLSADTTFSWSVGNTNRSPEVTSPGDQTSDEDESVTLQIVAADPDGENLNYSATNLPDGLSIAKKTGIISGVVDFEAGADSPYLVTVSASDGALEGYVTFTWEISEVNREPALSNPGDQLDAEADTISIFLIVNDADGDTVTFTATGLPPDLDIDTDTGEIWGIISYDAAATSPYKVDIVASDGDLTDSITFDWAIDNTNRSPNVTNPGDQSGDEGDVIVLQILGEDLDGESLNWLADGLPSGLVIDSASGEITGTILYDAAANSPHSVKVTASDGDLEGEVTFLWTVNNTNQPPDITSPGDQSHSEGATINLPVDASDPDGQSLTFAATGLPALLSIDPNTGVVSGEISMDATDNSPYTVTIYAGDGELQSEVTFTWTVSNTNQPPDLDNPGIQTNAENDNVALQLTWSDPDGNTVTFNNTSNLPDGLSLNSNTGLISGTITFDANDNSPYTVVIVANDGILEDEETFTWTVTNTNRPPIVVNPGTQTDGEGDDITLQVIAADPDGGTPTFTATGLPNSLEINANTGVVSGTIGMDASGTYVVTVTAEDTKGATGDATFTWEVVNTNVAPTANADDASVDEEGTVNIDLANNDTDTDGTIDVASIVITTDPVNGSLVINVNGTVDYAHDGSDTVSDSFQYTIDDNESESSDPATVNITVNPVNDLPEASDDDSTVDEGATVNINVANNDTDIDGTIDLASIVISTNPTNGALVVNASGTVEYTHDGSDTLSDSFQYTIDDNDGGTSNIATVSIVVGAVNDEPVANPDAASVDEEGSVTIDLSTNDNDVDGTLDLTTIAITTNPNNGTVVVNGDGTVEYTHDGSETLSDTFEYTINDDAGATSNVAMVSVNINAVNDLPEATDDDATVDEES